MLVAAERGEVGQQYPHGLEGRAADIEADILARHRHVAGVVAGHLSAEGNLGFVGAFQIPQLFRSINAFTRGAQSVNPDATTTVVWTGGWWEPKKEADATLGLALSKICFEGPEEERAELVELASRTEPARLRRMFRALVREMRNIQRYRRAGIPALEPVLLPRLALDLHGLAQNRARSLGVALLHDLPRALQVLVRPVVVGEIQHVEVQEEVPVVHVLAGVVGNHIDDGCVCFHPSNDVIRNWVSELVDIPHFCRHKQIPLNGLTGPRCNGLAEAVYHDDQ